MGPAARGPEPRATSNARWRQTVRWLVGDVPGRVEVSRPPQGRRRRRRPSSSSVRVRDAEYRPLDNAKVALKITLPGGDAPDARRRARRPRGRPVRGDLRPQAARRLPRRRRPRPPPTAATVGEREAGWAAQPAADEFARLEPDREFLETLAAKTGGEVVDGDAPRLVRRQPLRRASAPITEPLDVAALAPSALLPDRHRLPRRRMGPAPRQRPGLTN